MSLPYSSRNWRGDGPRGGGAGEGARARGDDAEREAATVTTTTTRRAHLAIHDLPAHVVVDRLDELAKVRVVHLGEGASASSPRGRAARDTATGCSARRAASGTRRERASRCGPCPPPGRASHVAALRREPLADDLADHGRRPVRQRRRRLALLAGARALGEERLHAAFVRAPRDILAVFLDELFGGGRRQGSIKNARAARRERGRC